MALRSCSRPSVPAHRCAVRRGRAAPRAATASGESFARRVVDTAGAWLVAHPAPLWLVNNPVKRLFTTASAGDYDVAATQEELRRLIDSDSVVLFSATYCPFSAQVKRDLAAQRVPYTVYETNVLPNGALQIAQIVETHLFQPDSVELAHVTILFTTHLAQVSTHYDPSKTERVCCYLFADESAARYATFYGNGATAEADRPFLTIRLRSGDCVLGGAALREDNKLGLSGSNVFHGAAAAAAAGPWELESAVMVITADFKLPGTRGLTNQQLAAGFAAARQAQLPPLPVGDVEGYTPVSPQSTRAAIRCLTIPGYVHWTSRAMWVNTGVDDFRCTSDEACAEMHRRVQADPSLPLHSQDLYKLNYQESNAASADAHCRLPL